MADPFLSKEALEHLTGYKVKPKQIKWLREHGIRFTINGKGRIVVRQDYSGPVRKDEFQLGAVS